MLVDLAEESAYFIGIRRVIVFVQGLLDTIVVSLSTSSISSDSAREPARPTFSLATASCL